MPVERKEEKKRPEHGGNLKTEWAQFYQALGMFNMNIVSRVMKDPTRVEEITKDLVSWCPEHDLQCDGGFIWEHRSNKCIRLVEIPSGG